VKLSIIIPVYRVEATLDRCIKSVTSQDFSDYELLLIDDGSPDHCPQMCDEWALRDSRIKVVHQANGGLSDARNTGLDLAQGDYVTFIDSDDFIAPGTLTTVMGQMADNDLLEYPIYEHYGDVNKQHLLTFEDRTYADVTDYWIGCQAYLHTYAANKVYRRSLFNDVRFPVGRAFEDAYTLPRLLQHSPKVATIQDGCYFYCANDQGITATATGRQLGQLLDAHLTSRMPMDDLYYLHLLNIQMDVCRLTGDQPKLPVRHVKPVENLKLKLKAFILNLFGIKGICKINKITHRLRHW